MILFALPHNLPCPSCCAGDLARIHSQVTQSTAGVFAAQSAPQYVQVADKRRLLEGMMSAALVVREPDQYKRWLIMYVHHLVGYNDQVRAARSCTPQASWFATFWGVVLLVTCGTDPLGQTVACVRTSYDVTST